MRVQNEVECNKVASHAMVSACEGDGAGVLQYDDKEQGGVGHHALQRYDQYLRKGPQMRKRPCYFSV